jgi:hypothetical protein
VFGSKTAVPNYDRFGNTVCTLAAVACGIDPNFVLRCLDDVPVVGPKGSDICEKFSDSYKDLCAECNIQLADECPKNEKAFQNQSIGKVLGIWFNAENLSWQYPEEKRVRILVDVKNCISSGRIELKQCESLLGRLNDFLQMCPFLKGFKHCLNETLSTCIKEGYCILSEETIKELFLWSNCVMSNQSWFPIPAEPSGPTIQHKMFISDAAGVPDLESFKSKVGVGGLGFDEEGCIVNAFQFFWEKSFVSFLDSKGAEMGSKTTTLEMIGILLHFLLVPKLMLKQHVVVVTDNMACFYAWENKCAKNDVTASIIVQSLHLIATFLECNIHVVHKKRCSNWESQFVDLLTRLSTTTRNDARLVSSFGHESWPSVLDSWMKDPNEDWSLALELLQYVKSILLCNKYKKLL